MQPKSYKAPVEITGAVLQINAERRTFKVLTDDGLRVTAPYSDENMHRVIEVLRSPEERLIKVSGLGEFTPDGTLKRMVKADRIIIAIARFERGELDPNEPGIGERIDAIIAQYPKEYWDNMPTDLVERHLANHGFYVDDEPVADSADSRNSSDLRGNEEFAAGQEGV